jgi:hypothetical protein
MISVLSHALTRAFFEFAANAAGTDAECVYRNSQTLRESAAVIDLSPLLPHVITRNDLAVLVFKLLETSIQTPVPSFLFGVGFGVQYALIVRNASYLLESLFTAFRFAQVFHEYKSRRYVAVMRRRIDFDYTFFFQSARHTIERFIRKFIRRKAILTIKVSNQPLAHFEVPVPAGFVPTIKPFKQTLEVFGL